MDPEITDRFVENELGQLEEMLKERSTEIVDRSQDPPSVRLRFESQRDGEVYFLKGIFDDYPTKPPFWEFYHPDDDEEGKSRHYPNDQSKDGIDTIFLDNPPVICHPASRKAYDEYTGKHSEWEMTNWREIRGDTVETIPTFVEMIHTHLNSPLYVGRMTS